MLKTIASKLNKNQIILFLLLILLFAAVLRFATLANRNLFSFDEVITVTFSQKNLSQIIYYAQFETNPPLYFFIYHFWIKLVGLKEILVRLLPIIISLLNVMLIYIVSRNFFSKRISLLSSFLLAGSSYLVYFAAEARIYPFLISLTLLSVHFFWRCLQTNKFLNWWFYFFFTSLLLLAHLTGIFILSIQILFILSYLITQRLKLPRPYGQGICYHASSELSCLRQIHLGGKSAKAEDGSTSHDLTIGEFRVGGLKTRQASAVLKAQKIPIWLLVWSLSLTPFLLWFFTIKDFSNGFNSEAWHFSFSAPNFSYLFYLRTFFIGGLTGQFIVEALFIILVLTALFFFFWQMKFPCAKGAGYLNNYFPYSSPVAFASLRLPAGDFMTSHLSPSSLRQDRRVFGRRGIKKEISRTYLTFQLTAKKIFLLLWLFLPLTIGSILNVNYPKFYYICLPAAALILAYGLNRLLQLVKLKSLIILLLATILTLASWENIIAYQDDSVDKIINYLQAEYQATDVILVHPFYLQLVFDYYSPPQLPIQGFLQQETPFDFPTACLLYNYQPLAEEVSNLAKYVNNKQKVFLIKESNLIETSGRAVENWFYQNNWQLKKIIPAQELNSGSLEILIFEALSG